MLESVLLVWCATLGACALLAASVRSLAADSEQAMELQPDRRLLRALSGEAVKRR